MRPPFRTCGLHSNSLQDTSILDTGSYISLIKTLISLLITLFYRFRKANMGTDFDILHNITGFCKDSEMLLVLGRPGSGCSTFLRVLANQRETYKAVSGYISLYRGRPLLTVSICRSSYIWRYCRKQIRAIHGRYSIYRRRRRALSDIDSKGTIKLSITIY